MTKLTLACGLALSAALAACSSAPPTASTASAAPAATTAAATAKVSSKPKLVCDDSDQMGSHFSHPICLTPEQVAQRQRDSQQAAQDMQQRAQPVAADGKPPV